MYCVNRRVAVSAVGLLAACTGLMSTAVADNVCNGKLVHNGEPCIKHLVDPIPDVGPRQTKCKELGPYDGPPPCNGFQSAKSVALNYKCSDPVAGLENTNYCGPKMTWASSPIGPVPVQAQGVCFRYKRCKMTAFTNQCEEGNEETLDRPLFEETPCQAGGGNEPPGGGN